MKDGSPQVVQRVTGEIDSLRAELGTLVAELDRRRHELFDVRQQLAKHPVAVLVAAGAAALALGAVVAVAVRRRQRQRRPATRVREARRALARLLHHPDRVAAEPSVTARIMAAVGTAAGAALARRAVERLMTKPGSARA
ncbi:MAG: hypothetical protein QM767_08535 [Anaeromyxobacter sp.]